jgi:hypothetical protein
MVLGSFLELRHQIALIFDVGGHLTTEVVIRPTDFCIPLPISPLPKRATKGARLCGSIKPDVSRPVNFGRETAPKVD